MIPPVSNGEMHIVGDNAHGIQHLRWLRSPGSSRRYNRTMALRIYVDAYSGYKANERPRLFDLDGEVYEISSVVDKWYEPSATYFKLRTTDFRVFILRYDEQSDEWTLQVSRATNYWRLLVLRWCRLMPT